MAFGYYSPQYPGYASNQNYMVQPQPQNNGIVWVQGEAGAKSYLMSPNSTQMLMDSESNKMYIKSTDGAGMPTMRVFEYKEVGNQPTPTQDSADFVLKADFSALKDKVEEIVERLNKAAVGAEKGEIDGKSNL